MNNRMIVTLFSAAAFSLLLVAGQAQALTRKECDDQWSSLSASKKAEAKTKTSFVKNCMAKEEAKGTKAEKKEGKEEKAEKKEKTETKGTALTAGQYSTEAEAKRRCGNDTVVWFNTNSQIYHFAGTSDYGHTKEGAYMCEKEANRAGRAAKDEKEPSKK